MAWYNNEYKCSHCATVWYDEWSCKCDDECPHCGARDHSPIGSDDISAFTQKNSDGSHSIYYSSPDAGHNPNYILLATVTSKILAKLIEKVAFNLAKPI